MYNFILTYMYTLSITEVSPNYESMSDMDFGVPPRLQGTYLHDLAHIFVVILV